MPNQKITVMTTDRAPAGSKKKAIPIELTFEVTPKGQLGLITARDCNGNTFVVGLTLLRDRRSKRKPDDPCPTEICCCPDRKRKKLYCFCLRPGRKCTCKK